ncbi:MAG: thiamine pyrophosphate-binding protein [Pseudomonadota bacterium]|nr:thiamine pyrophosphate-binding protein [Pseudomonadota bacterium]
MSQPTGNKPNGAEAAVRMLQLHGVETIFGLCGDTSLPFYDALQRLDHGMTHVLTRDERSAAYMADTYARVSGKVGVCEGPSGGGATYILPGVAEANDSSVPLLAITTDIAVSSRGRFTLTELDQDALFRPITKWNTVIDHAADVPEAFRTAFAQMTSGRPGAVHLGFPFDVQAEPLDDAEIHGDAAHGATPHERAAPDEDAVAAAAEAIAEAERPLFICGGGVVISGAEDALVALAEHIAAPVAMSISGQGSIADNHPLAVGVVGSNGGTPETERIVDGSDLVIFVGCRAGSVTTNRWRHPDPDQVRVVHIDIDPKTIGVNYRADAALIGDARVCLEVLHAAVADITTNSDATAAAVAEAKARKFAAFRVLAQSTEAPIRPERLVADLQAVLPDDAIIAVDPGTPCPYFSAYFECNGSGRRIVANRAHGALGYSLPAVLGAAFARSDAKCVAVMGDGAFGFVAGELETVARLGLAVTLVVVSNSTYGWIKAGQQAKFQGRYFSVDFDATDHAAVAAAYGIKSWRVSDPDDLRKTLGAAVECGGPTLVDVVSQPLHEANAPVSEWIA